MIELPRAALRADEIAENAEFFSFGTNDLTQTTFGISRDDSGRFLDAYSDKGIFAERPVRALDQRRRRRADRASPSERGPRGPARLKLGICGEHGGDPASRRVLRRGRPRLRVAARPTACRSPGWRRPRPRLRRRPLKNGNDATEPCALGGKRALASGAGRTWNTARYGDANLAVARRGLGAPPRRMSPGITGPPGVGKSSLCASPLVLSRRSEGLAVSA